MFIILSMKIHINIISQIKTKKRERERYIFVEYFHILRVSKIEEIEFDWIQNKFFDIVVFFFLNNNFRY